METTERKTAKSILMDITSVDEEDLECDSVSIRFQDGLEAMQEYATQQTEPLIKALKDRIGYYSNKGAKSKTEETKYFAIMDELNKILTIATNALKEVEK